MNEVTARLSTAIADRYRIECELGAGGMATVYLAHDVKHERKVALKVLRPELAAVIGAERFLAEIKVTANLQHPHILPLHDSGEADTFLYYVMPYVEGETLRDKIDREKQLGVEEAVEITRSVAAALDYAHRHPRTSCCTMARPWWPTSASRWRSHTRVVRALRKPASPSAHRTT
jgi:serine/threonine-protein kinase